METIRKYYIYLLSEKFVTLKEIKIQMSLAKTVRKYVEALEINDHT